MDKLNELKAWIKGRLIQKPFKYELENYGYLQALQDVLFEIDRLQGYPATDKLLDRVMDKANDNT